MMRSFEKICVMLCMLLHARVGTVLGNTVWNLNAFTSIRQCGPVQVTVIPSSDSSMYSVEFVGESAATKNLNAYVKVCLLQKVEVFEH